MMRVIIESPYAGPTPDVVDDHVQYARAAMHDSLRRGEAPLASHLLYTQVLRDMFPEERRKGMEAGFAWTAVAELIAVYTDLGISEGMRAGIVRAEKLGIPVEHRKVSGWGF